MKEKLLGKPVLILNLILLIIGFCFAWIYLPILLTLTTNVLTGFIFLGIGLIPIASIVLAIINLNRNRWSLKGFNLFDKALILLPIIQLSFTLFGLFKLF